MFNSFKIAMQILTVIPFPGPKEMELRYIGEGTRYFTLIGFLIGGILAVFFHWASHLLPLSVIYAFIPLMLAMLAGGSHMDGLMDTSDGLGSRRDRERMLEIMKDSRVGAYGVIFGVSDILLKFTLLSSLPLENILVFLTFFPVFGRWAITFSASLFPYARPNGLGKPFAEFSGWKEFIIATAVLLVPLYYFMQLKGIIILGIIIVVDLLFNLWLTKKLGGLTGDTYGAACEMSEILFLLLSIVLYQ